MSKEHSCDTSLRFKWTVLVLLFLISCIAGSLAGFRVGFERGYQQGADKREAEQPFVKVYSLEEIFRLNTTLDRNDEAVDQDAWVEYLMSVIFLTIAPDSWDMTEGKGTMSFGPDPQTLVVSQTSDVHEEITRLLSDIEEVRRRVLRVREQESVGG